jgi:NADPH:quinone reductase-like Zn-dependent oxidoreductase
VLDYTAGPISKQLDERVDAVVDLIGGDALEDAPEQVHDGSRVVSVIDPDTVLGQGGHYVFVRPSRENLQALTGLVESGKLAVTVAETFDLDHAADAHRFSEAGHPRGKVVITI